MREVGVSSIDNDLSTCSPRTTNSEIISCLNTALAGINVFKQKNAEAGRLLSSAQPTSQYPSATLNKIRIIQTYQKYELEYNEALLQMFIADLTGGLNPGSASTYISRVRTYAQKGNAALRQLETYYPKISPDDYSQVIQDTMTGKDSIAEGYSQFAAFSAACDGWEHFMKAKTYAKNKQFNLAASEAKNALADLNKAQSLGYPFDLSAVINDINSGLRALGYE